MDLVLLHPLQAFLIQRRRVLLSCLFLAQAFYLIYSVLLLKGRIFCFQKRRFENSYVLPQGFEALLVLLVYRSQVRLLLGYSHQKPSQVL